MPTLITRIHPRDKEGKLLRDPDGMIVPAYNASLPFADKEELLSFCNEVREAGGNVQAANLLTSLLPSNPNEPSSCLVANALNFECEVDGYGGPQSKAFDATNEDSQQWAMRTTFDIAEAIHAKMGLPVAHKSLGSFVLLPERIGNAARAFDEGHPEFEDYNRDYFTDESEE
jgi:hypothetical protein